MVSANIACSLGDGAPCSLDIKLARSNLRACLGFFTRTLAHATLFVGYELSRGFQWEIYCY